MDLVTELEENKNKIYNFYNINENDIKNLFSNVSLENHLLSDHLISKFCDYDKNPLFFLASVDSNIKKTMCDNSKLEKVLYSNFFEWFNLQVNKESELDGYCDYLIVLNNYYNKSLEEKNQIVDKFSYQCLRDKMSFFIDS